MPVSVLVTSDGPHDEYKWANITAKHIFELDPQLAGERLLQAQALQTRIAMALAPHGNRVQSIERSNLAAFPDHCDREHDVAAHMECAMADIKTTAKGSPWEDKINSLEWQLVARQEIGNHFATMAHVERLWHADRNPDNVTAQQYKGRWI